MNNRIGNGKHQYETYQHKQGGSPFEFRTIGFMEPDAGHDAGENNENSIIMQQNRPEKAVFQWNVKGPQKNGSHRGIQRRNREKGAYHFGKGMGTSPSQQDTVDDHGCEKKEGRHRDEGDNKGFRVSHTGKIRYMGKHQNKENDPGKLCIGKHKWGNKIPDGSLFRENSLEQPSQQAGQAENSCKCRGNKRDMRWDMTIQGQKDK